LISYLRRVICALLVVIFALGEVLGNCMLAYLGIMFLARHWLLKYRFAQAFRSLDLVFCRGRWF